MYADEKGIGMHKASPGRKKKESQKPLGPRHAETTDTGYMQRWVEKAAGSPRTPKANQSEKEKAAAELEERNREKQRQREKKKTSVDHVTDTFCILMEYANAGNMRVEILRYSNRHLIESGARYYMLEIIAGLRLLARQRNQTL